jgi:hypothetical protein
MTDLHNIIYEVPLANGLHALIDEKSKGHYIFRIAEYADSKADVKAVANVSQHEQYPIFECYAEAVKMDKPLVIEDFRLLFEFLEFHVAWFKRLPSSRPIPYIVNKEYVARVYGSKMNLIKRGSK